MHTKMPILPGLGVPAVPVATESVASGFSHSVSESASSAVRFSNTARRISRTCSGIH